MNKYHIELIDSERTILARIDLREHRHHSEAYAANKANAGPILALMKSLSERSALPKERLNYWADPKYNPGRIKASRKELFGSNRACAEIYTHPQFLRYLRYFLFGAELPDTVIAEFEGRVGNLDWVTSGDIVPIARSARDLISKYGLDKTSAPQEFFKLCLDMGLGLTIAESVMRSAKRAL